MIELPSVFKSSARKRKDLFEYLKANALKATPENFKKGDTAYLIANTSVSSPVVDEEVDEQTVTFVSVKVISPASSTRLRVTFSNGAHNSDWVLNNAGLMVHSHFFDSYIKTKDTPIELDTSHLDKLVLEADSKNEIVNVLKQHKHMNKIFKEWGLDEVMEYGKAMSILFFGPPGTGKTWAANCIAKALQKELLIISAAEIQTSEPGGANRNIEAAFAQAKAKDNVLFLDECDSLITDRAHVGMIIGSEINTLLTALEKFEGVVIFATNRADTLDPAMARRVSLMVEFKNPDAKTRESIWEVLLPKKMPLAKDVSIKKLAKFELTGGYIKNVVLNAARSAAAEEASEVSMKHFAKAIKRIKETKDVMGTHTSRRDDFVKARG